MKKYVFAGMSLVLAVAGLWGVMLWLQGPAVAVVHPVRGPAVQAVYATGTVEASVMIPLAARSAARLVALNADEGSRVAKGDVLAQLEDEDLQFSVKQLQAREVFAKQEYDRNAGLLKSGAISRSAFDQFKTEWDAAKAATQAAEAQAAYLKLVAPADGLVIKRDGEIGQLIPANTPVFWLSCCAPLRIAAEVDEEDIAQVKPDQDVLIRADAFPYQVFHGRVQEITPKGDPVARSFRVRIGFTQDTPLQIGMTAETNIIIGQTKDALLVPNSAVRQEKIGLVKDGRLVHAAVAIGAKGDRLTEIKSGVTADDLVVVNPSATLLDGQKVRAVVSTQAAP